MVDVLRARKINGLLGFGIIAPWQVCQLDDAWLAALEGLYDIEAYRRDVQRGKNAFENVLAAKRAAHPTYRKY